MHFVSTILLQKHLICSNFFSWSSIKMPQSLTGLGYLFYTIKMILKGVLAEN